MRMRNKKNANERIEAVGSFLINDIESFCPTAPVHIEIGCGKGKFITETALENPEINYIAVEKFSSVIVLAMEKAAALELTNLKFVIGDVALLENMETQHFCERIYLNFSDPWPRKRHAKRRLTSKGFLDLYKKLLKPDGAIFMKTDNKDLFDYSIESFTENGFTLSNVTRDLHNSDFKGNIMTEYEKRFSEEGVSICRLEAYLK